MKPQAIPTISHREYFQIQEKAYTFKRTISYWRKKCKVKKIN